MVEINSNSNASLIPFDRIFKLNAESLKENYRVNLFKQVKKENFELLGGLVGFEELPGLNELKFNDENENMNETDDLNKEPEPETEPENENENIKKNKKKTRNVKISKKVKELDYDLDDPFIDDSEITDIYQSVFDLMRGKTDETETENENDTDTDSERKSCNNSNQSSSLREQNFFVYRGIMSSEILAKEFEIEINENFNENEMSQDDRDDENLESEILNGEIVSGKKSKKAKETVKVVNKNKNKISKMKENKKNKDKENLKKRSGSSGNPVMKKIKTLDKQKLIKKPSDLISQSAKKYNDLFSTEEENITVNSKQQQQPAIVVFNISGIDSNVLELREVLKRFREGAVGTSFSPGKFPSVLRPRLNETICACLRAARPSITNPLPPKLFTALASFLPFSASALTKLLTKKILGPLMEGIERVELVKMYEEWVEMVRKRIKEGGVVLVGGSGSTLSAMITASEEIVNNVNIVTTDQDQTNNINSVTEPLDVINVQGDDNINNNPNSNNNTIIIKATTSPMKRRLKFNDEMRQQVFEIVRAESDLNNLLCLSNLLSENSNGRVQSELNLRKIVYQKLVNLTLNLFNESDDGNKDNINAEAMLLSTTEISKEFGAQKRKHEKRIGKLASEILFGEAEVDEFLKELNLNLNTNTRPLKSVNITDAPPSDHTTGDEREKLDSDPCSSNTSLIIESSNL